MRIVTVLLQVGRVGGAAGGETPRVADSSAALTLTFSVTVLGLVGGAPGFEYTAFRPLIRR